MDSSTDPVDRILSYAPWQIEIGEGKGWATIAVCDGRIHGNRRSRIVARLDGVANRESARAYVGADIAVHRHQLPALESDEHYWCDLIGLQVVTRAGRALGAVDRLLETGANDVLVVRGEPRTADPVLVRRGHCVGGSGGRSN